MLDAVEMFGYGNWKDISSHVESKNEAQVCILWSRLDPTLKCRAYLYFSWIAILCSVRTYKWLIDPQVPIGKLELRLKKGRNVGRIEVS